VKEWTKRALLAVLLSTILTACATTRETVTDTSCGAFEPITFSAARDTPETVAQIREHNAAFDALCPPKRETK